MAAIGHGHYVYVGIDALDVMADLDVFSTVYGIAHITAHGDAPYMIT